MQFGAINVFCNPTVKSVEVRQHCQAEMHLCSIYMRHFSKRIRKSFPAFVSFSSFVGDKVEMQISYSCVCMLIGFLFKEWLFSFRNNMENICKNDP